MQYSSEEDSVYTYKIDGDMKNWTATYGMMYGDVGICSDNGDLVITVTLVITLITLSTAVE
jgi:hypothetical protein